MGITVYEDTSYNLAQDVGDNILKASELYLDGMIKKYQPVVAKPEMVTTNGAGGGTAGAKSIMQKIEVTPSREDDLAAYSAGYDYDKMKSDPYYKEVAKTEGGDLGQPAFIANQPGFNKAQAAVAAKQVTPRLDEEQMQDPREVDEYRRSIGKDARFATFDYGATGMPPTGGGGDGRVGPLSPTQLEMLQSTDRQSSKSPMAQDLGGWEEAPGSKVSPIVGGGDHRVVGTMYADPGSRATSDSVIGNLRKEGGLVSIPTSKRAHKSERVDRSTEPEVWQTSPEVLSSQGKLQNEMRANIEEEASAPPEHWETHSETMLRKAGSRARLAKVTKGAGKKIQGMSEYEKAPEHVQQLARGGIKGLGIKQLEKLTRRDLAQAERIKAEFVRKRLREAGL